MIAVLSGNVIVTKQEASDVVRAMEILSDAAKHWGAPTPDAEDAKYEGEAGARAYLIDFTQMHDKYKADLKWSRSILEAWRKKTNNLK